MRQFLAFCCLLLLMTTQAIAQYETPSSEHDSSSPKSQKVHGREAAHGSLKHHRVALIWGHGYIPKGFNNYTEVRTLIIPVIGLDYEYWFSHKFAIGISNDLELSNYVIEVSHEEEELEREYVYVGALMAYYEFAHLWAIGIGPGIEMEKNRNFFVVKTSIEKEFPIKGEGGWDVTPMFSYEFKSSNGHGVYDAMCFAIAIGKRF
ncbi:hypothetical protein [Flammeovirga sp. SubArs3]|uniref:hypothetical protein n=1 Tax=Flammeovirga sp. SubArs3 TaxID=2995316 RepID=UPI00248D124A|nr:hypothetical protein [Flammeovirga sp. SubArs3]